MINIAINGFGRIGRNIVRALLERDDCDNINLVAINDLGNPEINTHLLQYDSVHGTLQQQVDLDGQSLVINTELHAHKVLLLSERNPEALPWRELNVDIVFECTGIFTSKDKASSHIRAGAKKVILSAPGTDIDKTIVYGINHQQLSAEDTIISNASCTTNCLAPLCKVIDDAFGIDTGLVTTVHAYTNDQGVTDAIHSDYYRARSATQSLIPTKTGAAKAIGLVMPHLNGRLNGTAIRVPVINVSLVDANFTLKTDASVEDINHALIEASQDDVLKQVFAVNNRPLVSIDFNHNPASSIADINQTMKIGNQVKVLAWYDNEWGFSNRMLDTAIHLSQFC